MKIKQIEIKNYKAFYGEYKISVEGKNLFIYGENGSGKSSFYYALKDFFQSSLETIDFLETENIFLTRAQKGKGHIQVTFNPDKDGATSDKVYTLKNNFKDTYVAGDTSIRDAVKLKSFLTYKHLLGIHNIRKGAEIDLFELLVDGVLKHFKSVAITGNKELGELWTEVKASIEKETEGRTYNIAQKKADVDNAVNAFNEAFKKLFEANSIENILRYAQPILDKFGHNIQLGLHYTQVRPSTDYTSFERNHVRVKIIYQSKEIEQPHIFLNEARLSAIAISIYLGMVKRHIQGMPLKVLFLDDIFIGLDIGNRLPLLKILDTDFSGYQVFITTYDKPWYEFVKSTYLDNNNDWKSYEFYGRRTRKGFEIPIIRENKLNSHIQNYINASENFFNQGDNKAAGVYLRSAFEFILKRYCFGKKVPVPFYLDSSKMKTDEFWESLKKYKATHPACGLTQATTTQIDHYTNLVLNPLSHHDINKHEVTTEIQGAIATIKTLKTELGM
ncbi:AAA family ATPase [Mucilaginibacter sp. L3T2-6]|uniref:AAA family ATPase n=1 Tax=Mucilaginibacter sp. L3T2-6 TaxID=3062491 RepID=UPI0026754FBD|nr:AAA family ATPase [Mucilaginibacter sp. L3T2-6]MDO3645078.1 AAA family ATPase [Mucilaginibacter sp. L3T2-6]MDV6217529.1 AAA family ATPase [Mucilaginibacter sp. L3T2-6]